MSQRDKKKSPEEMTPKEQREFLQGGGSFVLKKSGLDLEVFALPGYDRYVLLNQSSQGWGGGDTIMYRLGTVIDALEQYATSGDLDEWEAVEAKDSSKDSSGKNSGGGS